jgi:hypothetical protein
MRFLGRIRKIFPEEILRYITGGKIFQKNGKIFQTAEYLRVKEK